LHLEIGIGKAFAKWHFIVNAQDKSYNASASSNLTERESTILRLVVRSFIETAGPIGSRYLARHFSVGLSAASIRNTMSDLEDLGYLDHPYTSAGRVPTERGYRTFVDQLMQPLLLSSPERQLLIDQLQGLSVQPDMLMRECSRLLGRLSNLLGVVLSPKLATGVLDRLEVVPLSSSRMIFVLSLRGGLVKTVVLELDSVLDRNALDQVVVILNERLAGLTMEEIRQTYAQRIDDIKDEHTGLVKLVLKSSSSLFSEQIDGRLSMAGAQNIVIQPEFVEQPDQVKTLVELLEDENFIVQLLEEKAGMKTGRASAWIGSEMSEEKVDKYALVTAQYQFGETIGTVGVIGPKRMNYARVFALVEGIAVLMSRVDPVRH